MNVCEAMYNKWICLVREDEMNGLKVNPEFDWFNKVPYVCDGVTVVTHLIYMYNTDA